MPDLTYISDIGMAPMARGTLMFGRFGRRMAQVFAIGALLGAATAASATEFTVDLTKQATYQGTQTYTMTDVAGSSQTITVKITAWHANDSKPTVNSTDSISAATLKNYNGYGTGVIASGESDGDGTHQINNSSTGADFIMLQFSKDVTLASIDRKVFSLPNTSCCDSDAAYWADTGHALGAASSTASINLASYSVDESLWTNVAGGSSDSITMLNSNKTASVWLVGAAFNQTGDAFKLGGFTATTITGAVPEPSSWAMMIIGFGAIGWTARRHKGAFRVLGI